MKTTTFNSSIVAIANKAYMVIVAIVLGLNFASCTASEDEPATSSTESVTAAQVTFTYTVPEELFRYAEITVAYNNNEGTDARWEPMLDNKFTVTYDLKKFPVTAPVVFIYDTTNRPASGVNVNWDITMDVEVTMVIDGHKVTKSNFETYSIDGDLGAGIAALQKNVLDRTYAVKLAKNGNVEFIH